MHAQRARAVVCETGDLGDTGGLPVVMYARACVWRAALPGGQLRHDQRSWKVFDNGVWGVVRLFSY